MSVDPSDTETPVTYNTVPGHEELPSVWEKEVLKHTLDYGLYAYVFIFLIVLKSRSFSRNSLARLFAVNLVYKHIKSHGNVLSAFRWRYQVQMSGRPEAKSEVYKYYLVSESPISVRPFVFELKDSCS